MVMLMVTYFTNNFHAALAVLLRAAMCYIHDTE